MKTKNKMFTIVEIAIVLCSVLFLAIPAIAAEQSQTTQEVSATASEDDFTLGVYGNANEDDTIDMRDVTYTKLIIFGKKPMTELADAYYDDEVDVLDVVQIKLIILGRESELTIVQYLGRYPPDITEEPVTVTMPIESIAALTDFGVYTLCAMGEADKIVAVLEGAEKQGEIRDLIEDVPEVGKYPAMWDMERILELNPDIVLTWAHIDYSDYREILDAVGIPLVQMNFNRQEQYSNELRNIGWMLNKQERVEELISFEQQHLGLIEERVKDLDEEQKPRVYFIHHPCYYGEPTHTSGKGGYLHDTIEFCGGINIFADLEGYPTVDPEEVIVRNPQVIYATTWYGATCPLGYDITDTGPVEECRQDIIMDYPGWDSIDAVKDGRVYFIATDAESVHPSVIHSYLAKWFHPDLFEDIDPVAIHREWLERFLGIEYKGVYAYPTSPV